MANFTAGTSFQTGVTNDVTAAKLDALVANAVPTSNLALTSTNGTIANFTSSTANITLGTIPTLTTGTTTSTAATITTGTIPTLVATTLITTGTGTAAAPAIVPTGDTNTGLFFPAADTIAFSEGGAEAMRIDSSGKVLIGTTSNDTGGRLEVKQASSETGIGIQSSGTDDSKLFFRTASGTYGGDILFNGSYVKFSSGTTERLRIDSSGNVGIGITSPINKLHLYNGTNSVGATQLELEGLYNGYGAGINFSSRTSDGGTLVTMAKITADGEASWNTTGTTQDAGLRFSTTANGTLTEALRIDSSGNVLIGGTAVEPAGGAVNGISLKPSSSATVSNGMVEICNANSPALILGSTTGDATLARFRRAGTVVGSISVTAGATAFVTSSDYRLKTNLEPISNGIERIKQLPVYRFNWIADQSGNKVDGFVAHEAQPIVPEAILGAKDEIDAEGNPIYQGIDQSKIVPLLTAALKEAITKIEVLESKVAALEAA